MDVEVGPGSSPRVLIGVTRTFAEACPELVPRLRDLGCCVTQCLPATCLQPSELTDLIEGIDIFISGFSKVTEDVLRYADRLRLIAKYGAGFDDIDLEAATARKIIVTNVPGVNASSVAELTIGLMIGLSRNICLVDKLVKAGNFRLVMGRELAGKCLGIIGAGKIGLLVAGLANAFGMTVLAYDVVRIDPGTAGVGISYVPLERLLQESEFVTVHVPLTSQTVNLIGERELRFMKSTAYLINVSRGGIVNEAALLKALQNREIAGAALDVHEHEPPGQTPLLALDNVIATAHIGGATHEAAKRIQAVTIRAVEAFLRGERPANVVNPKVFSLNW